MTKNFSAVTTDDLHAYVDGQLSTSRAAEIEAYLRDHPAAADEVESYRIINAALRAEYDDVLNEPIPTRLVSTILDRRPRFVLPVAAALVGMVFGAGLTWIVQQANLSTERVAMAELAEKSTAAYLVYAPEELHPVEVFADQSDHLSAWLSKRMKTPIRIPRLADLGFELVGGRLMVGDFRPAALLMYQNGQGQRMVLYVRNDLPGKDPAVMRYQGANEANVVTWASDGMGYGLAGALAEKDLLPAAQLVRAQISF